MHGSGQPRQDVRDDHPVELTEHEPFRAARRTGNRADSSHIESVRLYFPERSRTGFQHQCGLR